MAGRKREWMRRKLMLAKEQSWVRRFRVFSSAWRQHNYSDSRILVILDDTLFFLLSAIEAIVLVGNLCYFFLRFGFRL